MGRKKHALTNEEDGLVYSTGNIQNRFDEPEEEIEEIVPPSRQLLEVKLEKNHRGGKVVVIVSGFRGGVQQLEDLARYLKTRCGTGGSVKGRDILIQGDRREQVMALLNGMGFKTKRVGG